MISAVGLLSRPNIPAIEGIEDFKGPVVPHGSLAGRARSHRQAGRRDRHRLYRLPVDPGGGQGSRALYVFQRTPNWVYEAPGYLAAYPDQVNWLDRNFPYLTNFARFQAAFMSRPQNTLKNLQVDPDFRDEHAVSAVNKQVRDLRIAFLESKLGHRPTCWRR